MDSNNQVRGSLIRLAYHNPELRRNLLPLIQKLAASSPAHEVKNSYKSHSSHMKEMRDSIAKMKKDKDFNSIKSSKTLNQIIEQLDMVKNRANNLDDDGIPDFSETVKGLKKLLQDFTIKGKNDPSVEHLTPLVSQTQKAVEDLIKKIPK